ncbi:hypothetical protein D3C72_1777610 [compost metagenome]
MREDVAGLRVMHGADEAHGRQVDMTGVAGRLGDRGDETDEIAETVRAIVPGEADQGRMVARMQPQMMLLHLRDQPAHGTVRRFDEGSLPEGAGDPLRRSFDDFEHDPPLAQAGLGRRRERRNY